MGKMFLIVVDVYSKWKWMEVEVVNAATSAVTVEHHGLPEVLVTSNGSVFCSAEFNQFTSNNGILHIKTAPYHPSSNGLAERVVQTFKMCMKKQMNGTIKT